MNFESDLAVDSGRPDSAPAGRVSLRRSLLSFHREEKGDAVQAILIIFVAVIVLIALVNFFFPTVWTDLKSRIENLIEAQE
jgi:hypothetical protein